MDNRYTTAVVITSYYPLWGGPEPVFIDPDIRALAERFREVIVVPCRKIGDRIYTQPLPPNVRIDYFWRDHPDNSRDPFRLIRFAPAAMLRSRFWREPDKSKTITFSIKAHAFARALRRWIRSNSIDTSRTLFISNWFNYVAAAPMLLRHSGIRMVAIDHGRSSRYPYRASAMRRKASGKLAALYAVSHTRCREICEEIRITPERVRMRYLGCLDNHDPASSVSGGETVFITVCRMERPKRIAQMRSFMVALAVARTTPVRWIVAGEGSLENELDPDGEKPANLTIEHLGGLTNGEVHHIYNTRHIDWAMLLSDSEGGAPIALCEAIMHGVPVVANDAGGISEIVDDDCGLLLPYNPTTEEFVRGIAPMLDSRIRTENLRRGARTRWEARFDASRLRPLWVNELIEL